MYVLVYVHYISPLQVAGTASSPPYPLRSTCMGKVFQNALPVVIHLPGMVPQRFTAMTHEISRTGFVHTKKKAFLKMFRLVKAPFINLWMSKLQHGS